jgi:hypothetical protein
MDLLKKVIGMNLLFLNNKFLILSKVFEILAILTPSSLLGQVSTDTTTYISNLILAKN